MPASVLVPDKDNLASSSYASGGGSGASVWTPPQWQPPPAHASHASVDSTLARSGSDGWTSTQPSSSQRVLLTDAEGSPVLPPASEATSHVGVPLDDAGWRCAACTFINVGLLEGAGPCQMCGTLASKPDSAAFNSGKRQFLIIVMGCVFYL